MASELKENDAAKKKKKNNYAKMEFVCPKTSDYIECAMPNLKAENCNVTKRIIHFLQIYEEQQSKTKQTIYEYMQSLNGYDISQFFEDWHQTKKHRLSKPSDIEWMQNAVKNLCDGSSDRCEYVRRYQRDRERDKFDGSEDTKNHILMDQMDSIHTFLFHALPQRRRYIPSKAIEIETKEEEKSENDENIWTNKPQSINECNVKQILWILDKHIFDGLNEKIKEKLINYKQRIIEHVKEKQIDGSALSEMRRIGFIKLFTAHLNNKKVTGALGALYNDLMKYKLPFIEEESQPNANDLITASNKFVTDAASNESDKKQKKQFYSFGTKFLYNPKLKKSKMFVAAKYKSIKEEFEKHLIDGNKDEDGNDLLKEQMKIINSMDKKLQPLLKEFVNEQEITSADVLWTGDIETSRKQLKEIIFKLCEYAKDFDVADWDENNSNIAMESVDIAFKVYAIQKFEKQIKINKENYIQQQQQNKMNKYIEKCDAILKMESVKAMKAAKNKSNNDYGIEREQPIGFEHVFALILYSNCTKLCTLFRYVYIAISSSLTLYLHRGTYRFWTNESLQELKKRHSAWSNMGRLLYECFLFWASTNSKVAVLFHGMSVELFFERLQCKFNAPTSTTSEESVALGIFAKGGVVMKLESAESNSKYIKAIDMQLFTCFENEAEFFIFDSELRVNDLKIARINRWIGTGPMNAVLLFDLLSNKKKVGNEQLLKEKNQKTLIKILQRIADDDMQTFTNDEYVNTLIEALITRKEDITFNLSNTQSLIKELSDLYTDKNCEKSPFEIEHSNKNIVVCKLKKEKNIKLNWQRIECALQHELGHEIAESVMKIAKKLTISNIKSSVSKKFTKALFEEKMIKPEIEYTQNLISRSTQNSEKEQKVTSNSFESNVKATDIYELSDNVLIDIFDTIKAHKFIIYHFEKYTKQQFISAIVDNKDLKRDKNKIIDRFINYDQNRIHFNFYPTWLIADDPFIIFKHFFAASFLINKIRQYPPSKHFKLSMFIIPKKFQSLYDENVIFDHDLKNVQFENFSKIEIEEKDYNDAQLLMKVIESQLKNLKSLQNDITLIVDRRKSKNTLYIFNGSVSNIANNNLLGMEFHILSNVVLCYLVKGYGERIRFWPKWIPFITSRFFVRDWDEKKNYDFLTKCYSNEIKNGFGTKLNDETFEKYYHIISGSMHVCVNYDRKHLPFEQYVHKEIDEADDKIYMFLQSELKDIDSFVTIMESISTMNLKVIYEEFKKQTGVPRFESLFDRIDTYQTKVNDMSTFIKSTGAWFEDKEFDFDALVFDTDDPNNSYFYYWLKSIHFEEYFTIIREEIEQIIDQQLTVYKMTELGAYLCKRKKVVFKQFCLFYRWLNKNKIKWEEMQTGFKYQEDESNIPKKITAEFGLLFYSKVESFFVKKSQDKIGTIKFGVSVLEWLKWNEKPNFDCFRDEMLDKMEIRTYREYEIECMVLMRTLNEIPWSHKELMSVKFYTDMTNLQGEFRRAHWKSNDDSKPSFFWWALNIFMAVQYHKSAVLARSEDNSIPTPLYHGLSSLFIVKNGCPFYNGPISTTMSVVTGKQYTNNKGVVWFILSSYTNPFRRICGLNTERISSWAHEQEILLCNSYVPILKSHPYAKDSKTKIDLFMKQVQYFDEAEFSSDMFYDLIGFEVKEIEGWLQMIQKHELLYEPLTHFPDRLVIHRLRENLNLNEFDIPYSILIALFKQNDDLKWSLKFDAEYIEYFEQCKYKIQFDDAYVKFIEYDQVFELASNKRQRAKVYVLSESVFGTKEAIMIQEIN